MSIKGDVLPGGINQEIQGVTTQTRAHPDDFNPNVLKPLLDNDVTMSKQLESLPSEALTFRPGYQIVQSEQDTSFRVGEVKGRTLINLLGKEGNFDYRITPLPSFFATREIVSSSGPKCQKIVCNRAADNPGHFGAKYELNIDRSKHYVAVAYLDNVSCNVPVYFSFAEEKSTGYTSIRRAGNVNKGNGMVFRYVSISPADMSSIQEKLIFYFRGEGTADAEFRIGAFGLYEISRAEYEAIGSMKYDYVAEKYPYVDSMTNVKNPYAIVTGGNLLPPFYEMDRITAASKATVVAPYELRFDAGGDGDFISYVIPAKPHTDYTLSMDVLGVHWAIYGVDYNDVILPYSAYASGTFNAGNRDKIAVVFKNPNPASVATVKNPILTFGTEPKPFTPQQRSMLAFETELAAHPIDGSNPDTLFMGDDGLPYVLEPWKNVTLDGSLNWSIGDSTPQAGKQVKVTGLVVDAVPASGHVVKYDGKYIPTGTTGDAPDLQAVSANGSFYISVANIDSGWGPDYEPSREEIKAYFLGWKMGVVGQPRTVLYNGEGGRVWYKISMCTVNAKYSLSRQDWVEYDVPTYPAGVDSVGTYNYPYRLQYLKTKPTVEPVRNYELGATLTAGSNMVEVGSGIVIREKANPVDIGNGYVNLNDKGLPPSPLRYPTNKILAIYQNQAFDPQWNIMSNHPSGYGGAVAQISRFNYDPTAVYHVTYTMLDPTIPASISGTVAANLRGTVSDLVQDVGDVQRRLSVVETQKAEKDAAPPQWITPTLLNGWTLSSNGVFPARYYKDGVGIVHVNGIVTGGTTESVVFRLPAGYRPKTTIRIPSIIMSGANVYIAYLDARANGDVIAVFPTQSMHLTLQMSFLAEQ